MNATDLNEDKIVVLPDAEPSDKLGLQVHWRLSGYIEQNVFHAALDAIRLDTKLYPGKSNDTKYLKRAMEQLHNNKRRNLVRRLGDNKAGFSLVQEKAEALDLDNEVDDNSDPIDAHEIKLTAKVVTDESGTSNYLKITPENHPDANALRTEFERQRTLYHCGTDLSQWLTTKIIPHCNGLSGRDRGGFYYIPAGEDVKRFERILKAIRNVSTYGQGNRLINGFKVYTVPSIKADSVIEAVMDSLIEETDRLCDDLDSKITEEKLTHRGWAGQQQRAFEHEKKIKKYAKLLDHEMSDLTGRLTDLQATMGILYAKMETKYNEEKAAKKS